MLQMLTCYLNVHLCDLLCSMKSSVSVRDCGCRMQLSTLVWCLDLWSYENDITHHSLFLVTIIHMVKAGSRACEDFSLKQDWEEVWENILYLQKTFLGC